MRPTFSIIAFTVLSGLGYGAWFLQGLGWAIGPVCAAPFVSPSGVTMTHCQIPFATIAGFSLAFVLVSMGLTASLGHLGKPMRAWRAFSQWRSSWLSREGVAALLTFIPAALLLAQALGELWLQSTATGDHIPPRWWTGLGWSDYARPVLGLLLAAGAVATVFCTANIYASLKPIRAWHERHVVPAYLLLALYGGALLLSASATLDGMMWHRDRQILLFGTIVLAVICAWLKRNYWRSIDAQTSADAGHAIGLEALGMVRSFEQPHTEENYLTHEMGFVLARRHAHKLRRIALVAAFLVPAVLAAVALVAPATHPFMVWLAFASGMTGILVERWLFFAEAKHAVMAYYGR